MVDRVKRGRTARDRRYLSIRELERRPFRKLTKSQKFRLRSYRAKKGHKTRRKRKRLALSLEQRRERKFRRDFKELIKIFKQLQRLLKDEAGVTWTIKRRGLETVGRVEYTRWIELSGDPDEYGEYEFVDPRVLSKLMRQCDYEPLAVYYQAMAACEYATPDIFRKGKRIARSEIKWCFLTNAYDGDVAWSQAAQEVQARLIMKYFSYEVFSLSFTWL